jgi:hypothetical protein
VRHGRRTHLKLDRDWPWGAFSSAARSAGGRASRARAGGGRASPSRDCPSGRRARSARPPPAHRIRHLGRWSALRALRRARVPSVVTQPRNRRQRYNQVVDKHRSPNPHTISKTLRSRCSGAVGQQQPAARPPATSHHRRHRARDLPADVALSLKRVLIAEVSWIRPMKARARGEQGSRRRQPLHVVSAKRGPAPRGRASRRGCLS